MAAENPFSKWKIKYDVPDIAVLQDIFAALMRRIVKSRLGR